MRGVCYRSQASHSVSFALLDDAGEPVPAVAGFLAHLGPGGYSPNTVSDDAHDLLHFERCLRQRGLAYADFTPVEAVVFLEHLSQVPSRRRTQTVAAAADGAPAARLAPASINRVLLAVSSLFEYPIVSGQLGHCLRLPQEGPCECDPYLTCAKFATTPAYAPRLRARRLRELELVEDAAARGWLREVERHRCVAARIERLLAELGQPVEGTATRAAEHGVPGRRAGRTASGVDRRAGAE